jgi:hypothetical protein
MKRFFAVVMLCGAAIVFLAACARSEQSEQIVSPKPAAEPENVSNGLVSLPPLPQGKTTILGGEIQNVDPVRDQFSLQIYGQRPMKILFDERTQVYRDGVRVPVRDLGSEAHASVQTTLDGAGVFAVSIHILSGAPEGECQGRVVKYDPNTGELAVASEISPEPVTLLVPANVSIARVGEPEFTAAPSGVSDLVAGALISVTFESDAARRNVARQIKILAVPGAAFVFNGNISFLDMSTGIMVLVDPREGKSYQIHFDSARFPASETLRPGANATVTATYDGARYTANEITVN